MPFRLTTLHFAQRFLMDDDTFILYLLINLTDQTTFVSRSFHYIFSYFFRPGLRHGQDHRPILGYRHCMLYMRG